MINNVPLRSISPQAVSAKLKLFFKKINVYLIIAIFGLVVSLPLFTPGYNPGHDYTFHSYRYQGTINSIKDGQIIPQVDSQMLDGFGYSWNMFYGPLSSYFVTLTRLITPDLASAINMFTSLTIVASGIFLYRFVFNITKNKTASLFSSFIYMAAPYHLMGIYIRQAQGELLPFVFAPILMDGIYRLLHNNTSRSGVVLIAIGASGILLSHNLSVLIIGSLATIYILLNFRKALNLKFLRNILLSGAITLGVAAFYFLPLLELRSANVYSVFDSEFTSHYMSSSGAEVQSKTVDFARLLFNPTPITGGGEEIMPFSIGLASFLGIIVFFAVRKSMPKKIREFCTHFIIIAAASLIVTSPIMPWSILPSALHSIQFPWRMLMLSTLTLSVVSGVSLYYVAKKFNLNPRFNRNIFVIAISVIALMSSYDILSFATYNISSKSSIGIDYSLDYPNNNRIRWIGQYSPYSLIKNSSQEGEKKRRIGAHVIGTLNDMKADLPRSSNNTPILNYSKSGLNVQLQAKPTNTDYSIELPMIYYPGYIAYIETGGSIKSLQVQPSDMGLVSILIPADTSGDATIRFGMSKYTKLGTVVTLLTIVLLVGLTIRVKRRK